MTLAERLMAVTTWVPIRERDLSYMRVSDDDVLVVACDSTGGLGPKPHDTIDFPGTDLGRFAARVPLLELIAAGARPILLVDTLSVERDPAGMEVMAGVWAEAASAGLGVDAINGSTEENVLTTATGVGVTALGRSTLRQLRAGSARPPFTVLLLGRPMSAPEQLFGPDDAEVLSVPKLEAALGVDGVMESLPIGSRGVRFEFEELASGVSGTIHIGPAWPISPHQSGGPSTAALLAVDPNRVETIRAELISETGLPVWDLGTVQPG